MDELMKTLDTILEDITKIQEKQTAQLKFMEQKLIQLNSDLESLLSVIDSVNYTDEQEKPTSIH
jgi:TolA-binding protein